ncbi:MAG: HesA/MoeB/ThiF family protein [Methanocorpusculum sp.]|nr:HesA/MoeB/ThiF family protein [Methanocorpusculum sp.]
MSERYARQISLIGEAGQKKLSESTVFVAGAGGLGSPVLFYLASAGIGNLRIADLDKVDESNLNRQILHSTDRLGVSKAESAKLTLSALNPEINITAFTEKIDDRSVSRITGDADIIVDCMDNFEARYVLNRFSHEKDTALVHGAVSGFSGQATLIVPDKTPCLSCIFPNAVTSEKTPVFGFTAGVIGSIEAGEAIKYLTGEGNTLAGKLLVYDGRVNSFDVFSVKKSSKCKVCGKK